MSGITQLYMDLAILAVSFMIGLSKYKVLDTAGKIVLGLLLAELCNEIIAHVHATIYHTNMRVYNIYSIVEFGIITMYFNYSIDIFRKRWGYYILAVGLVFALVNYSFIQPINTFNSYYLFFEGFTIITLALIAFYRLLMYNEDLKLSTYYHFWFTAIFLFFWSITFLSWGMFPLFKDPEKISKIILFIWVANVITYSGAGLIFLLYPRKNYLHE